MSRKRTFSRHRVSPLSFKINSVTGMGRRGGARGDSTQERPSGDELSRQKDSTEPVYQFQDLQIQLQAIIMLVLYLKTLKEDSKPELNGPEVLSNLIRTFQVSFFHLTPISPTSNNPF